MKLKKFQIIVASFVTVLILLAVLLIDYNKEATSNNSVPIEIALPFKNNTYIPVKYTCDGANINPYIKILNYEELKNKGKFLAIIVEDPDAPIGTFIHWVAYNIPLTKEIPENSSRKALYNETKNDFGYLGYGGPCPPKGEVHHYYFEIYLLNNTIQNKDRDKIIKEIKEKSIGKSVIIGLYQRK